MEKPLINISVTLEKFSTKGGWTFARISGKVNAGSNVFGWIKVKGTIDNYVLEKTHLMPMGNGKLFLPVKAAIRKQIKKDVGDVVKIVLYKDESEFEVPEAFMECLKDEPEALKNFMLFSKKEKKQYVDWINLSTKTDAQIERMGIAVNNILYGIRFDKMKKNKPQ